MDVVITVEKVRAPNAGRHLVFDRIRIFCFKKINTFNFLGRHCHNNDPAVGCAEDQGHEF
jgi:hypothetical protein